MHQHPPINSAHHLDSHTSPPTKLQDHAGRAESIHSLDRTTVVCTSYRTTVDSIERTERAAPAVMHPTSRHIPIQPPPHPTPPHHPPSPIKPTHHNQVYPPYRTSPSYCGTLHSPQPWSKASHSPSRTARTWRLRRRTSRAAQKPSRRRGKLLATSRLFRRIWM